MKKPWLNVCIAIFLLSIVVFLIWAIAISIHQRNDCHDRGGVLVRSQCIDRSVVLNG